MIKATTNISQVLLRIQAKVASTYSKEGVVLDKALRAAAITAAGILRNRVHVEGKKADGTAIGSYTDAYLKRRQKKFNRTADRKKIMSLTRQMENDLAVTGQEPFKTSQGYGIGFKNKFNADKADWLQNGRKAHTVKEYERTVKSKKRKVSAHTKKDTKGYGKVYRLTKEEEQQVVKAATDFIKGLNA